jgi:hypothetical protein
MRLHVFEVSALDLQLPKRNGQRLRDVESRVQ